MINFPVLYRVAAVVLLLAFTASCKHKKEIQRTETAGLPADSLGKCRLDFKSSKTLIRHLRDNEFDFVWINAKANVETLIDGKEESFDIRLKIRKDSAILISIQYMLGLEVAKVLITRDSVRMVNYIQKNYFVGDINYINNLLNAELDYDLLQALLFGNSAEFSDDEARLKPVANRQECVYQLSTERKRRLRKLQQGNTEMRSSLQILTLRPDNYKVIRNEFVEPATNRKFTGNYRDFKLKDSVYAPYHVDIDIEAQKNATVKIEYVRIEKNAPQNIHLNIPSRYQAIRIQKE